MHSIYGEKLCRERIKLSCTPSELGKKDLEEVIERVKRIIFFEHDVAVDKSKSWIVKITKDSICVWSVWIWLKDYFEELWLKWFHDLFPVCLITDSSRVDSYLWTHPR